MNCALELLAIKEIEKEKRRKEAEAEAERRRKEAEAYEFRRKQSVIYSTNEWCEKEIFSKLVESAKNCDDIIHANFYVRCNGDEFALLRSYISNSGREYYDTVYGWKDFPTLNQYLSSHCLKSNITWTKLPCCNGHNYTYGAILTIYVDNCDCLN